MKNFYLRLLAIIVWLCEQIHNEAVCGVVFNQVRVGGISITGDIKKMKAEFEFDITLEAKPVGGSGIEKGTAVWGYSAKDFEGNDVSSEVTVTPDPENELRCNFKHSGKTVESVGVFSLNADGDPDADEQFPVVGSLDIIVDSPNVTGFELSVV